MSTLVTFAAVPGVASGAAFVRLSGTGNNKTVWLTDIFMGPYSHLEVTLFPNGGAIEIFHDGDVNALTSHIWDDDGEGNSWEDGTGCESYAIDPRRAFCPQVGVERVVVIGGGFPDRINAGYLTIPIVAYGDVGDDQITGGCGNDELFGNSGNDVLIGDLSGLTCGSESADLINGGAGADTIDGGRGNDTVSYAVHSLYCPSIFGCSDIEQRSNAVSVSLLAAVGGGPEDDDPNVTGIQNDRLLNIENVVGTAHADTLIGDDGPNILKGGDGNDILIGLRGNDEMYGEVGNDTVFDELWGLGGGDDFLDGGQGGDSLYGQSGQDTLYSRDPVPGGWVFWADTVDCGSNPSGFPDMARFNTSTYADTVTGCEATLP